MIAKLRGVVDSLGAGWAVIDVGGVGYLVSCSSLTLERLSVGEPALLTVETHLREDALQLFGFGDGQERDWFRLLQTVQGVGSRVALAILSVLSPSSLVTALAAGDRAALQRADGVGAKLAARIVTELRDKASTVALGSLNRAETVKRSSLPGAALPGPVLAQTHADAVSALVHLGYGSSEAFSAVHKAGRSLEENASFDALVKSALRELAR